MDHGLKNLGSWLPGNYASVAHLRDYCAFGIAYDLPNEWRQRRNVIYAFVFSSSIQSSIQYIGQTTAGMAARFNGYRYGNPLMTDTDNRVKLAITRALSNRNKVEIWAGQPVTHLILPQGKKLEIPASKPLEEYLISLLHPELNVLGHCS